MSFGVAIGDIVKLCEVASRVYKNCRDCPGEYRTLTNEARSLTNLLDDIVDKYDSIPKNKKQQLLDAFKTCVEVLHELDKILLHYNSLDTRSQRTWDRLKWDPERSKAVRERLTSSVVMLNGFYNSLIHDSQVLILEALGRLERDYRSGHREESVASVQQIASEAAGDDSEDDAAWAQIIRDLEDVGITRQDALEFHDFIVDWFVRAVNEGRLMENHTESQGFPPVSRDLEDSLLISHPIPVQDPTLKTEDAQQLQAVSLGETPSVSLSITTESPAITEDTDFLADILTRTARRIIAAWKKRDFPTARKYLEAQLAMVERGETSTLANRTVQPDRRLLRHLIGVCASYTGDFLKAKESFDSILNGLNFTFGDLDEGDIAAARWLGDACLHLHEPYNTALAWSVALSGLIHRCGEQRDLTQNVFDEIAVLNNWLHSVRQLEQSLKHNVDPTNIIITAHATEKHKLIESVVSRLKSAHSSRNLILDKRPLTTPISWRSPTAWGVDEYMLYAPPFELSWWPLQWDSTFLPTDAVIMVQYMAAPAFRESATTPLSGRGLPTVGLINAKELHYVTKRSQRWLVEAVTNGLDDLDINYRVQGTTMICRLNEGTQGFVYAAGFCIKFKKLQLRKMYGLKVTEAQWVTRTVPPVGATSFRARGVPRNSTSFLTTVRSILARAEHAEESLSLARVKNIGLGDTDSELDADRKARATRLPNAKAGITWVAT